MRRRYERAFDAHRRVALERAAALREEVERAQPAAAALARLDAISALGGPAGGQALAAFASARDALAALLAGGDAAAVRAASVTLDREPPLFARAEQAVLAVQHALEHKRTRFAGRAAALALERRDVPALDRLLQVIAASDVDGIERVLDECLAAHIDRLLTEAAPVAAGRWSRRGRRSTRWPRATRRSPPRRWTRPRRRSAACSRS